MVILRWVIGLVLLLVFSLFAIIVYLALNEDQVSSTGEPPLIRAEGLPFKEEPAERGGAAIVNEDSSLVQALDRGPDEPVIEQILPPPEQPPRSASELLGPSEDTDQDIQSAGVSEPLDAPTEPEEIEPLEVEALVASEPDLDVTPVDTAIAALPQTTDNQASQTQPSQTEEASTAIPSEVLDATLQPAIPEAEEVEEAPALPRVIAGPSNDDGAASGVVVITPGADDQPEIVIGGSDEVEVIAVPVDESSIPEPVADVQVPPRQAALVDEFRVQLSALREREQAVQAWAGFQSQFPDILADAELFITESQTDRGLFYRVQVGLYGSRLDADNACNAIKAQGGDCFVVRSPN